MLREEHFLFSQSATLEHCQDCTPRLHGSSTSLWFYAKRTASRKHCTMHCIRDAVRYAPSALRSAHSYRSESTGFASAALIACVLTVTKAMSNAITLASTNIHQPISMR